MAEKGPWVPVLDGSGWERFSTEDGVMYRQFRGVDDEVIAEQAKAMRNDIAAGKHVEGGHMAFHMPTWIMNEMEQRFQLNDRPPEEVTKFWRVFGTTPLGKKYTVRGM